MTFRLNQSRCWPRCRSGAVQHAAVPLPWPLPEGGLRGGPGSDIVIPEPAATRRYRSLRAIGLYAAGSWRSEENVLQLSEIDEINVTVTAHVLVEVASVEKHRLHLTEIDEVDLAILVKVSVTHIAEAVAVGIALIGVCNQCAVVVDVIHAVEVAIKRLSQVEGAELGSASRSASLNGNRTQVLSL